MPFIITINVTYTDSSLTCFDVMCSCDDPLCEVTHVALVVGDAKHSHVIQ